MATKTSRKTFNLKQRAIQAVIFDFDGVIGKTMEDNFKAWQFAFSQEGVKLKKLEYFLLEGMSPRQIATALCKKYRLSLTKVPGLYDAKKEHYIKHNHFSLYPGARQLLSFFVKQHLSLAVVSGAARERFFATLPKSVAKKFVVFVNSEDVKNTKPHPEPYLQGAKKLGLRPRQCLAIENAPLGINSAKKAGMFCIAISSTLPKHFLRQADGVVKSIAEIKQLFTV